MNGHPARLASTLALAFGLVTQGCNPKEAAPAPALISPNYTPLAAQVCFDWLNQVKEATQRFDTSLSWTSALETCTDNLAGTANWTGWPVGDEYDSTMDQTHTRQNKVAIAIAGQLGLPEKYADSLAEDIREANPEE